MKRIVVAWAAGLAGLCAPALGAEHAWISAPLRSQQPETYFTNLQDGDRITTPFVLKFGLARYGLAPIVKPVDGAGHHHLLVNRDLPLDFKQPLPFNEQYIHFGKGQMETVLNFAPGEYTLRLLLADHKHIPYFIYSKPMRITVTAKTEGVDPKSLVKPGIAILAPVGGEPQRGPFRVRLHASGYNVGHSDITDTGVGHFRLVAEPAAGGAAAERIELAKGLTEVWLAPPPGRYKLRAELIGNGDRKTMAESAAVEFEVQR